MRNNHLKSAFRPGTYANHHSQFTTYIKFCQHYNIKDIDPTVDTICLYATYLATRLKSSQSIANYLSAVRLLHKYLGLDCPALTSFDLHLTTRAIKLANRHIPTQRRPLTREMLCNMCSVCDSLQPEIGTVLKVALLFGFCGFLRQSNLAPRRAHKFDPTRDTCRGDILIQHPGIVIAVKWTKTRQLAGTPNLIPIPKISDPILDPVAAYHSMIAITPTSLPTDPLLQLPRSNKHKKRHIVTTSFLRNGFKLLVQAIGQDPAMFSPHSLRRGGATLMYNRGVSLLDIQRHGTWTSHAFLGYIANHDVKSSTVATSMAKAFNQSD